MMELTAAYEAVRNNPGPLIVVRDSTYVVKRFLEGWYAKWLLNGWRDSKRKPVKNQELWKPFIDLVLARGDVAFQKVKGHSGVPGNVLADSLASEAALIGSGRQGFGTP